MPNTTLQSKADEALLSWVKQFAHYGVITIGKDLIVLSWNRWMEIHSGKKKEEVTGKEITTIFPNLMQRKFPMLLQRALQGESSIISTSLHHHLVEMPSVARGSEMGLMRQTARIVPLLVDREVCGIVIVIEDVTQREEQAELLRRQHRRDEILSWALAALLTATEPRKTTRQLFFKVAKHLDFDTFLIYFRDDKTANLVLNSTGGLPTGSDVDFSQLDNLPKAVVQSKEMLVFNNIRERTEHEFISFQKAGFSSAIAIPMLANEELNGVLFFGSRARTYIQHDESDLLHTIAQYLAMAIHRETTREQLRLAQELLTEHAQVLEEKVQGRTAQLNETIAELETFTYTVAHDLKQPIRGIIGFCDVLLEDFGPKMPAGANLIIKRQKRAAQRMELLTRDLLRFSSIGNHEVVLESTELEPIIQTLSETLPLEHKHAVILERPLLPVKANKTLLQQVFSNLVDNALKFIEPNQTPSIRIRSEAARDTNFFKRSPPLLFSDTTFTKGDMLDCDSRDYVRIWVEDNGIGIPSSAHDKIFAIFERGVTAEIYEGTGIGLAIVVKAVKKMGGRCGVESELGKGSRFWIELFAG